eukprot:3454089-Rhodomonas_salina.1
MHTQRAARSAAPAAYGTPRCQGPGSGVPSASLDPATKHRSALAGAELTASAVSPSRISEADLKLLK